MSFPEVLVPLEAVPAAAPRDKDEAQPATATPHSFPTPEGLGRPH